MIIQSNILLQVGYYETGKDPGILTSDFDGNRHPLAFIVVRIATREDYIKSWSGRDVEPRPSCPFFYEIIAD